MKRTLVILLLALTSAGAFAQQAKIKALAQQMATATVKGDFKTVIAHTDPETVKKAGGPDAMLKVVTNMFAQLKKSGMTIRSATAGNPGPVLQAGNKRFCAVPETVAMAVPANNMTPKGVYTAQSTLLAVSTDNGANWYFVNSGSMSDEALYKLYPEVKGKISLPKQTPPQFTPEQ